MITFPSDNIARRAIARSASAVIVLAAFAYIFLTVAELGGIGSGLEPVPQAPLPFDRSQVFGLDLSDRSSVEALQWLESTELQDVALVDLAIDADIIAAATDPSTLPDAERALEALFRVAGDFPLAVCLERPVSSLSDDVLADSIIESLRDRFTARVAYVSACNADQHPEWQASISNAIMSVALANDQLLPLTVGARAEVSQIESTDDLRRSHLRAYSGDRYVLIRFEARQPLDAETKSLAVNAMSDAAQIALILVRPSKELDPATFARSMSNIRLNDSTLPEGFTNVSSPIVQEAAGFGPSRVGTVDYLQTDQVGASIVVEFVGTEIFLLGIRTPDGGSVSAWLEDSMSNGADPHATVDFSSAQARDAAILLASELPAARHRITIVTNGGEVSVSGFFVSGKPEAGWNSFLTSVSLIVVAVTALTILFSLRIVEFRERTVAPPPDRLSDGHPREFTRAN